MLNLQEELKIHVPYQEWNKMVSCKRDDKTNKNVDLIFVKDVKNCFEPLMPSSEKKFSINKARLYHKLLQHKKTYFRANGKYLTCKSKHEKNICQCVRYIFVVDKPYVPYVDVIVTLTILHSHASIRTLIAPNYISTHPTTSNSTDRAQCLKHLQAASSMFINQKFETWKTTDIYDFNSFVQHLLWNRDEFHKNVVGYAQTLLSNDKMHFETSSAGTYSEMQSATFEMQIDSRNQLHEISRDTLDYCNSVLVNGIIENSSKLNDN